MKLTIEFLKRSFNKFNKLYFNNELPEIQLKISRTRAFGQFHYQTNRITGETTPIKITLSKLYDRTQHDHETTMIHEMIHYYICYKKIKDNGSHGFIWHQIADKISGESDYVIKSTSPMSQYANLGTKYYFVIFNYKGGKYFSRIPVSRIKTIKDFSDITLIGVYESLDTFFQRLPMKTSRLSLNPIAFLTTQDYKKIA